MHGAGDLSLVQTVGYGNRVTSDQLNQSGNYQQHYAHLLTTQQRELYSMQQLPDTDKKNHHRPRLRKHHPTDLPQI